MGRTVWVCHRKPTHHKDEFKLAKKFGNIKVLMEDITGKVSIYREVKLAKRIAKKLEKSKKDDLVLLCGNRAPVAMVVAIWMQLHGSINVLIYNPKKGGYEIKSDFGSITSKAKRAK
jgi:hypothetical protein